MGGDMIGLVAVVLTCGIPVALMYTYYRARNHGKHHEKSETPAH